MKTRLFSLLALLSFTPACFAVSFDAEGYGSNLNGWNKKGFADYSFTDSSYRTHRPTMTKTPSGGLFLTTQVDLMSKKTSAAVCHLCLTFSSAGLLESMQIKGTVAGKSVDSGLVRRPEAPALAASGEGAAPVRPFHATDELVAGVFTAFDTELERALTARKADRKDLLSRIFSRGAFTADLSAGLRHNVNLILQNVGR